jgi:hypothetical protein
MEYERVSGRLLALMIRLHIANDCAVNQIHQRKRAHSAACYLKEKNFDLFGIKDLIDLV